MFYIKVKTKYSIIEFHNNWLGIESVIVNGQIVSKQRAKLGSNHYFTVFEKGHVIPYILTTRWDHSGSFGKYYLDLKRDGKLVKENIRIKFGTKNTKEENKFKEDGIKCLNAYEISQAIQAFEKALLYSKNDPEIFFHLACCYSIEEQVEKGFECIKKAVELNLLDLEMILNHEMLAFLRIQESFEEFLNSNFTEYEI